jgi:hypothetical protein
VQLTSEQTLALKQGHPVSVLVDHTECVMMRKDVFERFQDEVSPSDTYSAIESVLDQEEDPGLESYQDYKTQ